MGRHTRTPEPGHEAAPDAEPASGDRPNRPRIPVPLLPIFALVVAGGVVSYAFSTQQISLNFAAPAHEPLTDTAQGGRLAERDQGERASRDAGRGSGLVVAFRLAERGATGFTGTATITNRGSAPVARWSLAFALPDATVRSAQGGEVVETGRRGWVRSPAGAPALEPGQSVKIVFRAAGTAGGPRTCVLNREECTRV
ncbi:cellulose binding domain-containing protein [Actinomadura flavalba]|uniref:cellulose binding domain-containing protein n=1 Tax=Actinomadura flavalba TaxID=1120938 RepID=UPI00036BA935|nr:cellulose binding domain-containing protein [Actinomadura flavalba]